MYCPQCGTDSSPGLTYCRSCGTNLKVIGKAVTLSEAIARSDRGPMPKIREMMKSLKVDQVTEEVSRALEHMNKEIANISPEAKEVAQKKDWHNNPWIKIPKKTPAERRERHLTKGVVSVFSGAGLTLFLYYLSAALVLKLPPHIVAQIPFEIDPVVRMIWLFGAIPMLSGLGHIVAGLLIRPNRYELPPAEEQAKPEQIEFPRPSVVKATTAIPGSVTENTTELLEEKSYR
ncbi:MAG TPA: zinc ribbon domain-containing protein [Pyrinomonadaceae bacterium]|jgi:hypothetical protein|nr:zinc ribbon domain-containing protein [Pyrinomonadaceae bacterium]